MVAVMIVPLESLQLSLKEYYKKFGCYPRRKAASNTQKSSVITHLRQTCDEQESIGKKVVGKIYQQPFLETLSVIIDGIIRQ